ncbi:hypothetical protein Bpfe_030804 [Biomphalaria pfeifferi]|nr:hypothetical protein Bpfe_031608 [Biomphalaria pfeifferi]KAK0038494.1 hypothetical protein Bpfe_031605 [Biomphalaria pfeifferi]KAK0038495.1 hypothetical protein Bpfe_031606 [Biomphalaria pfeifferi]KAK0038904.1 hypothetical protein Bpfe_031493 [Biomphalaria pfeifferi]KAK0038905.1 hypothetical protein Bpfe_031494 [Biomphalaria pfeifferi]
MRPTTDTARARGPKSKGSRRATISSADPSYWETAYVRVSMPHTVADQRIPPYRALALALPPVSQPDTVRTRRAITELSASLCLAPPPLVDLSRLDWRGLVLGMFSHAPRVSVQTVYFLRDFFVEVYVIGWIFWKVVAFCMFGIRGVYGTTVRECV